MRLASFARTVPAYLLNTPERVAAADGLRQPQEREVLNLILPRNRQPHSGGLVLTSEERDDGAF